LLRVSREEYRELAKQARNRAKACRHDWERQGLLIIADQCERLAAYKDLRAAQGGGVPNSCPVEMAPRPHHLSVNAVLNVLDATSAPRLVPRQIARALNLYSLLLRRRVALVFVALAPRAVMWQARPAAFAGFELFLKYLPVWAVDNIWPETVAFALAVGWLVNAEGDATVN